MDQVTERFLDFSLEISRTGEADAVLVYADVFEGQDELAEFIERAGEVAVVLARRGESDGASAAQTTNLHVPQVKLTRMGQVKVAVLLGLSRGIFRHGQTIVCLTGMARTGRLDGVVLMEVGKEFELFAASSAGYVGEEVQPEVLERVFDIAVSLGNEGREGKPVGTTFVLGDTEKVLEHSDPMILNPFKGYSREERDILDPEVQETVKELSTIDGAFIITAEGEVEAAGVFLKTADQNVRVPRGLGARHKSAAAITELTDSVAITVSESSGNVTVFGGGKVLIEIEKPHPIGHETMHRRRFFGKQDEGVDYEGEAGGAEE